MSERPPVVIQYLNTVSDMLGFGLKLPFRWTNMELKPWLPLQTKIGYGLMLNAVTDMWLVTSGLKPGELDPFSIKVVKNFIGYMNTIDDFLDDPKNKHASLRFPKGHELWERRKELFESIRHYDAPMQQKLKQVISSSTYTMLKATEKFRESSVANLEEAIALREGTAGELARVTAELFNVIHDLPEDRARAIERSFACVGMIMQVYDDVGDLGTDAREGTSENVVLQLLNCRPDEKARLLEALGNKKRCVFSLVEKLAPETAKAAMELQDKYQAVIPETGGFERIGHLVSITVSLRRQFILFRLVLDNLNL